MMPWFLNPLFWIIVLPVLVPVVVNFALWVWSEINQ